MASYLTTVGSVILGTSGQKVIGHFRRPTLPTTRSVDDMMIHEDGEVFCLLFRVNYTYHSYFVFPGYAGPMNCIL